MPQVIIDPVPEPLTRAELEAYLRETEPDLSDAEVERLVNEALERQRRERGD